MESTQREIRIVALSETWPHYVDVAQFLKVNPEKGLFYFDYSYKLIPLRQTVLGFEGESAVQFQQNINKRCYQIMLVVLKNEQQLMIFVHGKDECERTAQTLRNTLSKSVHDEMVWETMPNDFCNLATQQVDYCADMQSRYFCVDRQSKAPESDTMFFLWIGLLP